MVLYKAIDQVRQCVDTIIKDPGSRRILFHGWNCAQLDEMALPPCHLLYQFHPNVETKEISLTLYIRSNDLGLGTPFNIAVAFVTGAAGFEAFTEGTVADSRILELAADSGTPARQTLVFESEDGVVVTVAAWRQDDTAAGEDDREIGRAEERGHQNWLDVEEHGEK